MKTKHTPGPWKVESPSGVMLDAGYHSWAVYTGTEVKPNFICEIHFTKHEIINNDLEENKANAKLIAAAPWLLETLYAINCLCADASNKENGKVDYDKVAKLSLQAIKKATE